MKGKKPSLGNAPVPKQSRLLTHARKGNVNSRGLECSIYIISTMMMNDDDDDDDDDDDIKYF